MRRRADPALSLAVGAALTVLCSYPTVVGASRGAIDVSVGAARIVVTLAITCCAVHLVATLVARLIPRATSAPPPGPGVVHRLADRGSVEHRQADAA